MVSFFFFLRTAQRGGDGWCGSSLRPGGNMKHALFIGVSLLLSSTQTKEMVIFLHESVLQTSPPARPATIESSSLIINSRLIEGITFPGVMRPLAAGWGGVHAFLPLQTASVHPIRYSPVPRMHRCPLSTLPLCQSVNSTPAVGVGLLRNPDGTSSQSGGNGA